MCPSGWKFLFIFCARVENWNASEDMLESGRDGKLDKHERSQLALVRDKVLESRRKGIKIVLELRRRRRHARRRQGVASTRNRRRFGASSIWILSSGCGLAFNTPEQLPDVRPTTSVTQCRRRLPDPSWARSRPSAWLLLLRRNELVSFCFLYYRVRSRTSTSVIDWHRARLWSIVTPVLNLEIQEGKKAFLRSWYITFGDPLYTSSMIFYCLFFLVY
jgi:hypothetical protein